jgi:hypothetical protein
VGNCGQCIRIHIKKISATFDTGPGGGGSADIKEIRAISIRKKIVPNVFIWLYYNFCAEYSRKPDDIDDLCLGLTCLRAKQKIQELSGEDNA